jgi:hypothetical protein
MAYSRAERVLILEHSFRHSTSVDCFVCVCNHSSATAKKIKFVDTAIPSRQAEEPNGNIEFLLLYADATACGGIEIRRAVFQPFGHSIIQQAVTVFLQSSKAIGLCSFSIVERTTRRTCCLSLTLPVSRNLVIVASFITSFSRYAFLNALRTATNDFYATQRSRLSTRSTRECSTFAHAQSVWAAA